MSDTVRIPHIARLTVHGSGGCTVDDVAAAAYELGKQFPGVKIDFVHNDRRYLAALVAEPVKPDPPQAHHPVPVEARE